MAWSVVFDLNRPRFLEVNFFDIGQGDAIFIQTPKRTQILIDGGPSSRIIQKLGEAMPFYDRSIDLIISTHPDADHLLGLIDVLKRYKVNFVGTNGTKSSRPEFQEFEKQIQKKNVFLKILKRGQRILVGDNLYPVRNMSDNSSQPSHIIDNSCDGISCHARVSNGVSFEILAPLEDFEGREVVDFNTSSIVLRMIFGENSFLFTADAPKTIEEQLVAAGSDLDSDILKVSHHGSRSSTTEIFLRTVTPEIAVIQVGKDNQYGHPHSEVLERLEKYGIKIFRTDIDGDIKVISDGVSLGRAVSGSTPSAKMKKQ